MLSNEERIATAKAAISSALGKPIEAVKYEVVGSTYIKDNDSSDVDILVLDESINLDEKEFEGWEYGGSAGVGNDNWMSWKRRVNGVEVNMLITSDKAYFGAWLTAAEVCRFLHLQGYDLRSASVHGVHEIIMEDALAEEEHKVRDY